MYLSSILLLHILFFTYAPSIYASSNSLKKTAQFVNESFDLISHTGSLPPATCQINTNEFSISDITDEELNGCIKEICSSSLSNQQLEKAILEKELSSKEKNWIEKVSRDLDRIRPLIDDSYKKYTAHLKLILSSVYESKREIIENSLKEQTDLNWEKSKKSLIDNLSKTLRLFPSQEDLERTNSILSERQAYVRDYYLEKLPKTSREKFYGCFNSFFKARLSLDSPIETIYENELKKISEKNFYRSAFTSAISSIMLNDVPDPYASFADYFLRKMPASYRIKDRVDIDEQYINLSWITMKRATTEVIDHELGHIASYCAPGLMNMDCLDELHKKDPNSQVKADYADEDFADETSILSNKNLGCNLLDSDKIRMSSLYTHINHHSSDLFRILRIELRQKMKLPESCAKFRNITSAKSCISN